MLSVDQISNQIAAYVAGRLSLNNFEDWFRDQSRNVHLWGDESLNEFADTVESLFSERYFESLDESTLQLKLQEAARHFASPFVLSAKALGDIEAKHSLVMTAAAIVLAVVPTYVGLHGSDESLVSAKIAVVGEPSMQTASATGLVPLAVPMRVDAVA